MSEGIESPGQKAGGVVFGLAIAFCSLEMVPGWGLFDLEWPPETFYAIMGVCGALSGALIAEYRFAGLVGGAVAGLGSLYAIVLLLENVNTIHSVMIALAAAAGSVPGVGLYWVLRFLLRQAEPSRDPEERPEMEQRRED
jgi:hypothetical protein